MDKAAVCVCVYTHTMEYYSAIEMKGILPFTTTWMDLEHIKLAKCWTDKEILCEITYMWNLRI